MICPRCNENMKPADSRGVPSHICPQCSGTWIGGVSLNALFARELDAPEMQERLEAMFDLEFNESQRMCPPCKIRKLKAVHIGSTELDFCVVCKGLFFDKGELERVYPNDRYRSDEENAAENHRAEGNFWTTLTGLFGGNR